MAKLKSLFVTAGSLILVLIHTYIGHYFAPAGIDLLPITMFVITLMLFQFTNWNIYFKLIITALLFLLLDIGIKLYAGGTHDLEGLEWMNLFYFLGVILCSPIILYKIFKSVEINLRTKILLILLFIVFLYFQNDLLGNLGLGRHYPID